MLVSPKAKQATNLIITCIIAAACVWAVYLFCLCFSSPSSGTGLASHEAGPVLFDDPNDIHYWPSIPELQWFAQTKPDGLFRKTSHDDYELRRSEWYCNMSARATWPRARAYGNGGTK